MIRAQPRKTHHRAYRVNTFDQIFININNTTSGCIVHEAQQTQRELPHIHVLYLPRKFIARKKSRAEKLLKMNSVHIHHISSSTNITMSCCSYLYYFYAGEGGQ
jgi:hypothetical protein